MHETNDISEQLDALVEQANQASAQPPAPDADAAAPDGSFETVDAALDGDAFADQVQEMLDAAVASAEADAANAGDIAESPAEPESAPAPDPTPEPVAAVAADSQPQPAPEQEPAPDPDPEAEPDNEDADLILEIDEMLAANADDALEGDFESIEQVELADDPPAPAPAPVAPAVAAPQRFEDEPEPAPDAEDRAADADADLALDAGTFEPADAAAPVAAEASDGFAGPADVAAELDAADVDELNCEMEPAEDLRAAQGPLPDPDDLDRPAPAAAAADETPAARGSLVDALIGVLAKVNAPIMKLAPTHRDLVGCVAFALFLLAAGLWAKALFGAAVAGLLSVPLASVLGVLVYFTMLKAPASDGSTRRRAT